MSAFFHVFGDVEMSNNDEIKQRIVEYLKPAKSHHAMLLYGEWGSGKSYFVRNDLKAYLEGLDDSATVIYTTAAGFTTPDELMERIATAYINELASIEELPDGSKRKKLLNEARKSGLGFLKKITKKVGKASGVLPSLSDSAFLSLMLPKRSLIVIDDLERRAFSLAHSKEQDGDNQEFDDALFSALCRLVEEHGHKVLLIANSGDVVPADITEKLVWDRLEFKPDPAELVDHILAESIEAFPQRLNVEEQVISAQRLTGKCNARRLIHFEPLLDMMAQCEFFKNDETDIAIQKDTLKDVTYIALCASDGAEFVKPGEPAWIAWDEFDENRAKYSALKFLKAFIDEGIRPDVNEVNSDLVRFAERFHPQSYKEQVALAAINSIRGRAFEDEEGKAFLNAILEALDSGEMDISNIPNLLHAINLLRLIGIASLPDYEHAVQASERLLMKNSSFARSAINEDQIAWQVVHVDDVNRLDEIDSLRKMALRQFENEVYSRMMTDVGAPDEEAGLQIAHNADAWFGSDPIGLTAINPDEFGEFIKAANVVSIQALWNAIDRMNNEGVLVEHERREQVKKWNEDLAEILSQVDVGSKMRNYLIGQLCEYLRNNTVTAE